MARVTNTINGVEYTLSIHMPPDGEGGYVWAAATDDPDRMAIVSYKQDRSGFGKASEVTPWEPAPNADKAYAVLSRGAVWMFSDRTNAWEVFNRCGKSIILHDIEEGN